ncbi:hypothetical protein DOTSEDRAFT_45737 [Dothistroma septosporum NZE10]|uniref:Cell pattern formation-associated protein stuA n=1 Tax=Dothistroma septosporum (strain NZE10 / CBS 128990) TaxID=675120 RepID=STUA_DOTSN|nr:RecName: Full=Cell pattern formation-associated protein stuA; AltName: Full=Stunted protein A [Dothistroma septosporum NZE10]EME42179.1 hypothetical protein DOTSEDRAFT_45737 [Dothistroma septosporum NZE10]
MNQPQPYMDQHAPAPPPASNMTQYSNYGAPQPLQPATHGYGAPTYPQYGQYGQSMPPMQAGHPVSAPMQGQMVNSLPLPTMSAPQQSGGTQQFQQSFDTTGQIAPHGMKPRVTATLWEDEGSLCFQVEANGVCVARREDNHMINGTKLLNVAGMTRGRRDGILKSEKTRHVVKIGPMHLKGVWIPFDRALDFANKEKITELLYPLFVHNIGALLYHPTNQARQSIGNATMAARRPESSQEYMRTPQGTQAPALTHHHSMSNPINASMPPQPHSIAPHPASGRPQLDRAHTFPTPPASASSMPMTNGNMPNSYEYGSAGAVNSASTPPSNSQGMPQYQTSQPPYTQSYSTPGSYSQPQYTHQQPGVQRFGNIHSSPDGVKTEMGPPARAGAENDHPDHKVGGYGGQQDAEGEHEGEYTHTSASYGARRLSYNYKPNPAPGPLHQDSSHVSPEMTHSPHQNGSGRATPRTTNPYTGYNNTPQRQNQLPSSNLNYVMSSDARAGAPNGQEYAQQAYQPAPQYPAMNGIKRGREDDDQVDPYGRPSSALGEHKRQRTDPGAMSARPISQPHSIKAGGAVRR